VAKKPYFKVAGLGVMALVVAWAVARWAMPKPYLSFSTETYTFSGAHTIPGEAPTDEGPWERLGEVHYKWIDDVDADGIPDLAISNSDQPPWVSRKRGMKDWVWMNRIYSGGTGELLREVVWNDDEVEMLGIIGSDGNLDSIRYMVNTKSGSGTQSLRQDFAAAAFTLRPRRSHQTIWNDSLNGIYATGNFRSTLVGSHDPSTPITTIDKPIGEAMFFVLPEDRTANPSVLAHLQSGKSYFKEGVFKLGTYAIPGGKLIKEIDIWDHSLPDFDPDSILTYFDVNQDGQKDWLIDHTVTLPGDDYCREFTWFDGNTGELLKADSAAWSRLKAIPPTNPYPNFFASRSGFFEIISHPKTSSIDLLAFRPWDDPAYLWNVELQLNPEWGFGDLEITEFPDLDGDSFPDFGFVTGAMIDGQSSLIGSYSMPLWETEARLISGATGKPLLESMNRN
jgi:hypothetical protein